MHHHYKLIGQFRWYRVRVAMMVLLAMGWSAAAGAAVPALSQVAEKYISCSKPILREHGHTLATEEGDLAQSSKASPFTLIWLTEFLSRLTQLTMLRPWYISKSIGPQ